MSSQKQLDKWYNEAVKINSNPDYVQAYVEYRQKAKKADQRLVRLEALAHEQHFSGVLEFAYKGAIRDVHSWGGDRRFNTAPPTKLTQLQAKIADIDKFLDKPTSRKSGIVSAYKRRADTFNEGRIRNGEFIGGFGKEFGVDFTWEEIAIYYEREKVRKQDVKLASKTEVRAIAMIKKLDELETGLQDEDKFITNLQANEEELKKLKRKKVLTEEEERKMKKLIEDIQKANDEVKRVSGRDKILEFEVKKLLKKGLNYDKLFGGN